MDLARCLQNTNRHTLLINLNGSKSKRIQTNIKTHIITTLFHFPSFGKTNVKYIAFRALTNQNG